MPIAGPTLRIERLRAHVTATALAAHLGISRQTLWTIERAAKVDNRRADAYRAGVQTLRDANDEGEAA